MDEVLVTDYLSELLRVKKSNPGANILNKFGFKLV